MRGRELTAVAAATTVFMWASAFVAIRIAVTEFSVGGLTVGRLLVAAVALGAAAPLLGIRRPARPDLARLLACGLTGMAGYQVLLNAGERTVAAGTAVLLVKTGPIFAALLAWVLLSARPSANTWVGVAFGFVGASIITLSKHLGLDASVDALLILGAAAAQATFFVLEKPLLDRYTAFEVTCYATWAGALMALPAAPWLLRDLGQVSLSSLASVLFLGVGPSAIGFAAWAYALARLDVATAANTLYLVPPITVGIGWLLLGETPTRAALLGGVVIITGVAISRRSPGPPVRRQLDARKSGSRS